MPQVKAESYYPHGKDRSPARSIPQTYLMRRYVCSGKPYGNHDGSMPRIKDHLRPPSEQARRYWLHTGNAYCDPANAPNEFWCAIGRSWWEVVLHRQLRALHSLFFSAPRSADAQRLLEARPNKTEGRGIMAMMGRPSRADPFSSIRSTPLR
jgi:hypothetical protein